jgi:arylsulfatase A-like enzyme
VDIFPTLSDLCRIPAPHTLQGKSFASLLDDPQGSGKKVAYTVVSRGKLLGRSIRTTRWRYAEWGSSGQAELYDLKSDPYEDHNLSEDTRHLQQRQTMHQLLVKAQAEAQSELAH